MSEEGRRNFLKFWYSISQYYQKTLNDAVLVMYAEDCEGYTIEELSVAFKHYKQSPQAAFFPLPHTLINLARPQIDPLAEANEVPARIFDAIRKFGYNGSQEAREFMGALAWQVCEGFGGYYNLCTSDNLGSESTIRAQIRDAARSRIVREQQGRSAELPGSGVRTQISDRRETNEDQNSSALRLSSIVRSISDGKKLT